MVNNYHVKNFNLEDNFLIILKIIYKKLALSKII